MSFINTDFFKKRLANMDVKGVIYAEKFKLAIQRSNTCAGIIYLLSPAGTCTKNDPCKSVKILCSCYHGTSWIRFEFKCLGPSQSLLDTK